MYINKKKLIKRLIILVLDVALTVWVTVARFGKNLDDVTISLTHALSDGFFVVGFLNLGFGLLFWVSSTGFFDIFGYSAKAILNFFIPRSMLERMGGSTKSGDFYEYKVKKAEKRKNSLTLTELLWVGGGMILISLIFMLLI